MKMSRCRRKPAGVFCGSLPADLFHELDDRSYVKTGPAGCGNGALKKEPFSVNRMLTEAIDHLEIFAELKGVKIRVCGMEAQVQRVGDLDWNREAVQNILKNAIEHSKEGENVTVTLSDNAVYRLSP